MLATGAARPRTIAHMTKACWQPLQRAATRAEELRCAWVERYARYAGSDPPTVKRQRQSGALADSPRPGPICRVCGDVYCEGSCEY